ncbi:MAG TPA: hypothetical protein DCE18_05010 [Syntrophobacteraceae bacterium]|jgi:hypothetical protein|nr:hypothetical protein [Syntrophobacteraceae bacterium]HBZ56084.1 hypothetical protein [Syntrophobacteraceae bacterium]
MDNLFLLALLVTISVETPLLVAGIRLVFKQSSPSLPRILLAGCFASSWSLPYLWFLVPRLVSGKAYIPVGESLVILGEAIVFQLVFELRFTQCLILSALCNLASTLTGVALFWALE